MSKITAVSTVHRGIDYGQIEITHRDGSKTEAEVAVGVYEAISWLEAKNAEKDREIKRLLQLPANEH